MGNRFKLARMTYNKHGRQSVKEVSEITGVTGSLINDLETSTGKTRDVGYSKIVKLAKHYGISTDYLLGISYIPSAKDDAQLLDGYKEFLSLRRYLFDFWNKQGMDECHKSYEGAFELLLSFPCYFDEAADKDEPDYYELTLHCYVLGPHRHYHWRGNRFKEVVKEARNDIERWIKEEMECNDGT